MDDLEQRRASLVEQSHWHTRRNEILKIGAFSQLLPTSPLDPSKQISAPRWPSRIREIDDNEHMRGFYGLTVLAGKAGVGKSMQGYSSSVSAAQAGWQVVHFDTENEENEITNHISRITGKNWQEWAQSLGSSHRVQKVRPGITMPILSEVVAMSCREDVPHILCVMDSVHRLAQYTLRSERKPSYWVALEDIYTWAMSAREQSDGRIAFLLIAEMNFQGATKGQNLDYAADVVLKLNFTDDREIVNLDIAKSRQGGGRDLGAYFRDWNHSRFVKEGQEAPF